MLMKAFMLALGLFIGSCTADSQCHAAEAELCKPYARLATERIIRQTWMQAYSRCLNAPEAPIGDAMIYEEPAGSVPAVEDPTPKEIRPVSPEDLRPPVPIARPGRNVCGRSTPSPFEHGTREQRVWCKAHYGSFNARHGTVRCRTGKTEPCA